MKEETVRFFSDREEELINTLTAIGYTRRIAVVLAVLARKKDTMLREIEHGTDLQYSAISQGMKYLLDRGWVRVRKHKSPDGGHATGIYSLALPFPKILDIIEKETKEEMKRQVALVRNMKINSR